MKKTAVAVLCMLFVFALAAPMAQAGERFLLWLISVKRMNEVAPVSDAVYNEECGACHFAYQPGLLPEGSWRKVMDAQALEDHFGENAELDEETRTQILGLLVSDSAEKSYYKRSRKIMSTLRKDAAPMRITEVPYIRDVHDDVMEDVVKKSGQIKSLALCDKCHARGARGRFDDDSVLIPGYGYWTWPR